MFPLVFKQISLFLVALNMNSKKWAALKSSSRDTERFVSGHTLPEIYRNKSLHSYVGHRQMKTTMPIAR